MVMLVWLGLRLGWGSALLLNCSRYIHRHSVDGATGVATHWTRTSNDSVLKLIQWSDDCGQVADGALHMALCKWYHWQTATFCKTPSSLFTVSTDKRTVNTPTYILHITLQDPSFMLCCERTSVGSNRTKHIRW